MKLKALLSLMFCLALATSLSGCTVSVEQGTDSPTDSTEQTETKSTDDTADEDEEEEVVEEPEEPASQPISVGQNVQNDDFSITLTSARVDSTLKSDASTTYWAPQDGGAFVILEFDVTALNSNQLPVDDYAITDLCANYNGDTYQGWRLQYISGQLWLSLMHTYLDANIPTHIYAYTTVPSNALNEGTLSVDMTLAGAPYTVTIR